MRINKLKNRIGSCVNVTHFGAISDEDGLQGIDNTKAFREAVTYALSTGVDIVVVPPGKYYFKPKNENK